MGSKISNKKFVSEYLGKYLSRDPSKCLYIPTLTEEVEENHLERVREDEISDKLKELLNDKLEGVEIMQNESGEDYNLLAQAVEDSLEFLEDLEKFYKLFKSQGIKIGRLEILSTLATLIVDAAIEEERIDNDQAVDVAYKFIAPLLKDVEWLNNPKKIIFFMMSTKADINEKILTKLFDKLGIDYKKDELNKIIEECKEEFEIALFEDSLSSPKKIESINIDTLNGHEFEEYLKNVFKKLGYIAIKTKMTGDQGADLVITDNNEKIVVQAKKYKGTVSNKAVQEVTAAISHYRADRGMVVTTGSFTKSAIELALSNRIDLWDGKKLKKVIKELNKL